MSSQEWSQDALYCSGETLGDLLEASKDVSTILVLALNRNEIGSGLVGDAVDRLMVLTDSKEWTLRYEDRLTFYVSGYDADSRELYEIPEVVKFFQRLTQMWPYWLHFLVKEEDALRLALNLLDPPVALTRTGGDVATMVDMQAVSDRMLALFGAMNGLYAMHGIGMDRNVAMTDKVMTVLDRAYNLSEEP